MRRADAVASKREQKWKGRAWVETIPAGRRPAPRRGGARRGTAGSRVCCASSRHSISAGAALEISPDESHERHAPKAVPTRVLRRPPTFAGVRLGHAAQNVLHAHAAVRHADVQHCAAGARRRHQPGHRLRAAAAAAAAAEVAAVGDAGMAQQRGRLLCHARSPDALIAQKRQAKQGAERGSRRAGGARRRSAAHLGGASAQVQHHPHGRAVDALHHLLYFGLHPASCLGRGESRLAPLLHQRSARLQGLRSAIGCCCGGCRQGCSQEAAGQRGGPARRSAPQACCRQHSDAHGSMKARAIAACQMGAPGGRAPPPPGHFGGSHPDAAQPDAASSPLVYR